MKNLKNILAAITLAAVLMIGTANAGTGVLLSELNSTNQNPCGQTAKQNSGILMSDYTGILVAGFTGILVAGFTGIIVTDSSDTTVNCGILLGD